MRTKVPTDTRLCAKATTRAARNALVAALQSVCAVRVFPYLTAVECARKHTFCRWARDARLKVVDRGDACGLCNPRKRILAHLELVALNCAEEGLYTGFRKAEHAARRRA